jgi:hypothetical protein
MRAEPEHRGILAVDIQSFGRLDRSNPLRARMRAGLHRILGNAMTAAGIDPDHVAQTEYGDGVVVLLNPQVSKARLLNPLPGLSAASHGTTELLRTLHGCACGSLCTPANCSATIMASPARTWSSRFGCWTPTWSAPISHRLGLIWCWSSPM